MLAHSYSAGTLGIDAVLVEVECDVRMGVPGIAIVGLPDAAVKESRDRVRAALLNSGYAFPRRKAMVNLAPADLKKEGPVHELPIACAVLAASEQIDAEHLSETMMLGELALDGRVRPVAGVLPAAMTAAQAGVKRIIVPAENASEAAVVEDIEAYGVSTLAEAVGILVGADRREPEHIDLNDFFRHHCDEHFDFSDVRGQEYAKRAFTVAAAGGHNILLIGPPGSGKSMMAKRLPSILPRLTLEEALETTKVHSVAGKLDPGTPLVATRPFRGPHHTVSYAGLVGGGAVPGPGEISLAHNGVLFLDEFPEFDIKAREALRQPLEDRRLTVSRAQASVTFPANVMLVAAMNPSPTGYFSDDPRASRRPSERQVQQYWARVSGPLLDRIDIQVEILPVPYEDLSSDRAGESSAVLRERVQHARRVQQKRLSGSGRHTNADMTEKQVKTHCRVDPDSDRLLRRAVTELGFSARAYTRILKVARTCADLGGAESISAEHVTEAIGYRALDRVGLLR